MSMPGITELLVIFAIVMVLFGARRLPQLGGAIGESIRNFRKGIKDGDGDKKALPGDKKDDSNHHSDQR